MRCNSEPAVWHNELTRKIGLTCTAHSDCRIDGQEVVSCMDPTGTHNWPGKRPGGPPATCVGPLQQAAMPEQQACQRRTDSAPHLGLDLIWTYFHRYTRD
jgi:hypothetical protein